MRRMTCFVSILSMTAVLAACASTDGPRSATSSAAYQAHDNFVNAINSNDTDLILAMLAHDAVLMPPNAPSLIGKPAIQYWVQEYLSAFQTHWVKSTLEFTVVGDWAFEQYSYESTDTPRDGGEELRDIGKGIIIYHRDSDGVWLVARDAWNSDLPLIVPDSE